MRSEQDTRVLAVAREGTTRIFVRESSLYRELVLSHGGRDQSQTRLLHRSLRSGWPCTDGFHLGPLLCASPGRILFVGCGGGIGVRQFARRLPSTTIEVVDSSGIVIELARRWFGLDEQIARAYEVDGRVFIGSRPDAYYDVVISDVWNAGVIPTRFVSEAYWHEVWRVLSPGGVVVANVAGCPGTSRDPVHRIFAGARAAFGGECARLLAVPGIGELPADLSLHLLRNMLLLARKAEPLPSRDDLATLARTVDVPWLVHLGRIVESPPIAFHETAPFDDAADNVELT